MPPLAASCKLRPRAKEQYSVFSIQFAVVSGNRLG